MDDLSEYVGNGEIKIYFQSHLFKNKKKASLESFAQT